MAAAIVVSPLVDTLIKNLSSAIWKKLGLLWGVKDDFQKLQRLLSNINYVLEDVERRSQSIDDRALQKWLKDLKEAAFDADDVLDEFQTEALRRMDTHSPTLKPVNFDSPRESLKFRYTMANKIKEILKRFDEIAEAKAKFHLIERYTIVNHSERETFSFVQESEIFGRKDDKEKVIEWLTNKHDNKDVDVLPIVGLGGVGKTTLAQLIYNDEKIKTHFNIRMWVWVAEDFDVKIIVKALLECATKTQCVLSRLEDIHHLLREKLKEERFLLILDDLWNEDALKWETLKLIMGGSMEGSKIIVTTRSQIVADITSTTGSSYKLQVLSDDDNWELFKKRAFGPGREQETPNLVHIGRDILKKCGGLPLAAKSLGSLMATKRGEVEWSSVKNSEVWRLGEGKEKVLPALRLSYDHLSPQLKGCFAYCSVFPKDFRINKLKLVQLWVAEGLVQSKGGMHAEDIGNQYFNMLLWRSFFQQEEKEEFAGIVSYLACFVAKDESCIAEISEKGSFPSSCRYLSVIFRDRLLSPTIVENVQEAIKVRSLFQFGSFETRKEEPALWDAISNLPRLRVLYLSDCHKKIISLIVGRFKHLRFLDLSASGIALLPDSITNLYNLQTLNLHQCDELLELPNCLQSMNYLRHLDIRGHVPMTISGYCGRSKLRNLHSMPCGLGRLTNLQTLPWFMVGEGSADLTIVELQHLNQIRGGLIINGLQNVKDPADAMRSKLSSKMDLQCLGLCWERSREESRALDVAVLENLQPPINLKYLKIEGYGGSRFPNWLTNSDLFSLFNSLVELVLLSLDRCKCLPPLGQLPSLKRLTLSRMHSIKKIGEELYGGNSDVSFTSLKFLCLGPASNLEEWSVLNAEMFPCLETLRIEECPKLGIQPFLPSSIVELYIDSSNEELLAAGEGGCLRGLSNLRKLHIWNMNASTTRWMGLQYLSNLQELRMVFCHDLSSLPEGIMQLHFPSFRTLELYDNNLMTLGELEQGNYVQPPPLFTSLHHLSISYYRGLNVLPEWFKGFTSLQSLTLEFCSEMEMLPDALQHLRGLEELKIMSCSVLEKRCKRDEGEDWHKISHIPIIMIRS